jgi:hypothetical protein
VVIGGDFWSLHTLSPREDFIAIYLFKIGFYKMLGVEKCHVFLTTND